MRRALSWVVSGMAVLAGCSSSSDAESGGAGTATAAICAPMHHVLPTPNPSAYRIYASDAEAYADAKTLLPKSGRKAPLPPGSALQPQAEALVKELYPAFRALFPEETEGLDTPPRVLMIDDPRGNAFAFRDRSAVPPISPWVIVFHTGAFGGTVTTDDLLGVVGHEMAHLILRNGLPEIKASYSRSYRVTDEASVFGAAQPNDAAVAARAKELQTLRGLVGLVGLPELLGVSYTPLQLAASPAQYGVLWRFAYDTYKKASPNPAACTKYQTDVAALSALFKPRIEGNDFAIRLDAKLSADAKAAATLVRADMLACLPGFKRSIAAIVQEITGKAPTGLDADEVAIEAKYKGTDFAAELIELTLLKNQQLAELEAKTDLPLDSLRVYAEEEDADVVSAYVLRSLGKDPRSVALFLAHDAGGTYAADCIAKVSASKASPFYGALRNDHPATCWRYWNVDRLARTLDESCPR